MSCPVLEAESRSSIRSGGLDSIGLPSPRLRASACGVASSVLAAVSRAVAGFVDFPDVYHPHALRVMWPLSAGQLYIEI